MDELSSLFPGLPADRVAESARYFQLVEFQRGVVVLEEGERDPAVLFLIGGEATISVGDCEITQVGAGAVVGEMGLFRLACRAASVRAASTATFAILERAGYDYLVGRRNPVAFAVERAAMWQLLQRLAEVNGRLTSMGYGPVTTHPVEPETDGEPVVHGWDITGTLQRSPLFNDVAIGLIDDLTRRFSLVKFAPRAVMCRQGDPGDDLFVIAAGEVDIEIISSRGNLDAVATMGPGELIGVAALTDRHTRMATCRAGTEVLALRMTGEVGRALVEQDDRLGSAFRTGVLRALSRQLAGANERFAFQMRLRNQTSAATLASLTLNGPKPS
jgi:CRP/FNR family cyclic AMP-dependent transcriptional regulator